MDQATFTADCRKRAAAQLGADKLAEIIRQAYAEDQREVRAGVQRRTGAEISERAHNCPRGEFR